MGDHWKSEEKRPTIDPSAVKLVRDLKISYAILMELFQKEEKKLFYLFNFIPRLLSKSLCLTLGNFEQKRVNQLGIFHMVEALKHIFDKIEPIQKLAARKLIEDRTFYSKESKIERAGFFYEMLLLEEKEMVAKLQETEHDFSADEIQLLLDAHTHLREPIKEDLQNIYKKQIFSSHNS